MPLLTLINSCERLLKSSRIQECIESYTGWIQANESPDKYIAWFQLGNVLLESGRTNDARIAYEEAFVLNPDFAPNLMNLGAAWERMGALPEATNVWRRLLDLPGSAQLVELLNAVAQAVEKSRDFPLCERALERSLQIDPGQHAALYHWAMARRMQCNWELKGALPRVSDSRLLLSASPLLTLATYDEPAVQLLSSREFLSRMAPPTLARLCTGARYNHRRLRVGYLSSDFNTHAVGVLLADIFENHDRSKFETYGFCSSVDDHSSWRLRIVAALEHFERVTELTDEQLARRIRECEIDVLVDLGGMSANSRVRVLRYRPAPVQCAWLGFIGTTGCDDVDFVIADQVSLPPDLAPFFTERFAYLPNSFLPLTGGRPLTPRALRSAHSLPEGKFIFGALHNVYKLNETMVGSWMRILQRVPNSVLLLIDDNASATANLRSVAAKMGVGGERLLFAKRIGYKLHRERLSTVDLFLDNHPYNAGSTAVDVLLQGVPLLTRSGQTFVSRMAKGMLVSLGLGDLVTETHQAYEERAVALASSPDMLAGIRVRLNKALENPVLTAPQEFVRNLESLFLSMHRDASETAGEAVASPIAVAPVAAHFGGSPHGKRGARRSLLVRGWRGCAHPYARLTQALLQELMKRDEIEVFYEDLDFVSVAWSGKSLATGGDHGTGLNPVAITPYGGQRVDFALSICVPLPSPSPQATVNLSLIAPQLNPNGCLVEGDALDQSQKAPPADHWLLCPSQQILRQLAGSGFPAGRVRSWNLGGDSQIFRPLSPAKRALTRQALSIQPDDFVFLSVGPAVHSEGMDLVLRAFGAVHRQNPKVRLFVKDNREIWEARVDTELTKVLEAFPDGLSPEAIARVTTLSGQGTLGDLAVLYSIADLCLAPRRASTFDPFLLEIIFSGTRVLGTEWSVGAAGQFDEAVTLVRCSSPDAPVPNSRFATVRSEPCLDDLVDKMLSASLTGPREPLNSARWRAFVDQRSWTNSAAYLVETVLPECG